MALGEQKKARVVEVDSSKPLPFDEYEELLRHGRNSSLWYAGRFPSHSTKLRERLFEKGYPRGPVDRLDWDGELVQSDIVEEVMAELTLMHMIDDELYIASKLKSLVGKGKGLDLAARELKYKGVPEEEIEAALESLEEELEAEISEAVEKAAQKLMRSNPFRKATSSWQKSMVLSGGLRAKGFDRDTVDGWMEANSEIFED